jgi:hypothetical protein
VPHGNLRPWLSAKPLGLGRPAAVLTAGPTQTLAFPWLPERPVLFPEIIAGVPPLLAPPAGPANPPEAERIEVPAPGRRIPAKTTVTGAASRTVSSRSSFWALRHASKPRRDGVKPAGSLEIRAGRCGSSGQTKGAVRVGGPSTPVHPKWAAQPPPSAEYDQVSAELFATLPEGAKKGCVRK